MLKEVLRLRRMGRKRDSGNSEHVQKVGALDDINNPEQNCKQTVDYGHFSQFGRVKFVIYPF